MRVRSDFACYLCVLVSGFVESVVADIAADHCRNRSSQTVMNYVESRVARPGVLNTERLLQFVGLFNIEWRQMLEQYVAGERKDALDSVVANRNQIAHGESVNLTYARILEYYRNVCQVVDFVEEMFK